MQHTGSAVFTAVLTIGYALAQMLLENVNGKRLFFPLHINGAEDQPPCQKLL
jgi:hypothetical protein